MSIKLTRTERLLLSNQYRILAALGEDDVKSHEHDARIVEDGYEYDYSELFQNITSETFPEQDGRLVRDILNMFDRLQVSYDALPDKAGIDADTVALPGFDGNDEREGRFLGYAQHLADKGRYQTLRTEEKNGFNSHREMLANYHRMLQVWRKGGEENRMLSAEEIRAILDA